MSTNAIAGNVASSLATQMQDMKNISRQAKQIDPAAIKPTAESMSAAATTGVKEGVGQLLDVRA